MSPALGVGIVGYELLFYQIIHDTHTLLTFIAQMTQQSSDLGRRLENVSAVLLHFNARIDEWVKAHPEQVLNTPEQVLQIIRQNMHTLRLSRAPEFLPHNNDWAADHNHHRNHNINYNNAVDSVASDDDDRDATSHSMIRGHERNSEEEWLGKFMKALIYDYRQSIVITPVPEACLAALANTTTSEQ
jgi:hypothetical protein